MNYFYLELDTTPPELNIILPDHTPPNSEISIDIQSNEPLSSFQEIYLIDVYGDKIDFILNHENDRLYGDIFLPDIPIGPATLYIKVKDLVDNLAEYSLPISVIAGGLLSISIRESVIPVMIAETIYKTDIRENMYFMKTEDKDYPTISRISIRQIKTRVELIKNDS